MQDPLNSEDWCLTPSMAWIYWPQPRCNRKDAKSAKTVAKRIIDLGLGRSGRNAVASFFSLLPR